MLFGRWKQGCLKFFLFLFFLGFSLSSKAAQCQQRPLQGVSQRMDQFQTFNPCDVFYWRHLLGGGCIKEMAPTPRMWVLDHLHDPEKKRVFVVVWHWEVSEVTRNHFLVAKFVKKKGISKSMCPFQKKESRKRSLNFSFFIFVYFLSHFLTKTWGIYSISPYFTFKGEACDHGILSVQPSIWLHESPSMPNHLNREAVKAPSSSHNWCCQQTIDLEILP